MTKSSRRSIYRFIETIRVEGGEPQLLDLHQRRLDGAIWHHYFIKDPPSTRLQDAQPDVDDSSKHKWRVVYDTRIRSMTCEPYVMKSFHRLSVCPLEQTYAFKYENRQALYNAATRAGDAELPLFHQDGRIKDAIMANVALYIDGQWFTPIYPLLYGVMRTYLITNGTVVERDLYLHDLDRCEEVRAFNAMNPWEDAWTF